MRPEVREFCRENWIDWNMGMGDLTFWTLMRFVYNLGRDEKGDKDV